MANTPFFFREEKNHTYYHDFKVFIFGTDVTPWITSQVALNKTDRDGISSLSFNLSNTYRAFEITGENLGQEDPNTFLDNLGNPKTITDNGQVTRSSKFRLTDPYSIYGKYSELAKAKIYSLKKQVNGTKRNIKFKVQTLGPVVGGQGAQIRKISNEDANKATSEATDRYPMNIGSLIFHKYDPVRFFVKNPLTREDDQWTCEFTGYLDTKPYSQNYTNGDSTINITCQDIRILMSLMRVQVNSCSQVSNENLAFFGTKNSGAQDPIPLDSGLFNDFIVRNDKTHILGGRTWIGSMKFLLFGAPVEGGGRRGGIGKLKTGLTYSYDPKDSKRESLLENWNNVIVFGTTPIAVKEDVAPLVPEGSLEADPTKFEMMPSSAASGSMKPGTFLTKSQMYALGSSTVPDQPGSPDAAKVHFLLPAAGTPLSNCIEYDVYNGINQRVEFQTRLELLTQLCKNIDYQMYVSGMGDIIVEFPMYDFQPTDYNETYNNLYTFTNHMVSDNINDEGGSAISALQVTSRELFKSTQDPTKTADALPGIPGVGTELRQTIFSSVLASRIGPVIETHDVPGVVDYAQLVRLGYIEFNKRLANFNKFDMTVIFRPFVGINRPIYHLRKQRFGISSTVAYTWRLLEDVSLEVSLLYTRKREGNTFRFITGGERQPISYRTIYTGVKAPGMGVSDTLEKGDKPVSVQSGVSNTKTEADEANYQG